MVPVENESVGATGAAPPRPRWHRWAPLAAIVLVAVLVFAMGWQRNLSLETVVRNRTALAAFVNAHFAGALAAYVAIYIGIVTISLPGSMIMTMSGGILFGWLLGGFAAGTSATVGSAIIFLIAKTAFGELVARRAGPRLSRLMRGFRADEFTYLLSVRLVLVFPLALVNLASALVGVRFTTFIAATALGMVPGAFIIAAVGSGLDSAIRAQEAAYRACVDAGRPDCRLDFDASAAATPELIAALIALGLLALVPVAVKRVYARRPGAGLAGS